METELKELAVRPTSSPLGVRAVMIVTPVANMASEARNSRWEKHGALALGVEWGASGFGAEVNMGVIYPKQA